MNKDLEREKVVATLTKKEIIIADSSKKVNTVGKFKLPLEVIPFASERVIRQLLSLNGKGNTRLESGKPFLTDQGNYIIDADFGLIKDPEFLSAKLNKMVGVVEHGLFNNLASKVIMGSGDPVLTFEK